MSQSLSSSMGCPWCAHDSHPEGQKCKQKRPYIDTEPCSCRGNRGFWLGMIDAIRNAIGRLSR
jgi:hypothetical protein